MGRAYDSALSIVALGGVRCASLLWRAHHRLHASVIVKAGYTLRHGEAMAPSEVLGISWVPFGILFQNSIPTLLYVFVFGCAFVSICFVFYNFTIRLSLRFSVSVLSVLFLVIG